MCLIVARGLVVEATTRITITILKRWTMCLQTNSLQWDIRHLGLLHSLILRHFNLTSQLNPQCLMTIAPSTFFKRDTPRWMWGVTSWLSVPVPKMWNWVNGSLIRVCLDTLPGTQRINMTLIDYKMINSRWTIPAFTWLITGHSGGEHYHWLPNLQWE